MAPPNAGQARVSARDPCQCDASKRCAAPIQEEEGAPNCENLVSPDSAGAPIPAVGERHLLPFEGIRSLLAGSPLVARQKLARLPRLRRSMGERSPRDGGVEDLLHLLEPLPFELGLGLD